MDIYNINIQKEYFERYKPFFSKNKKMDDTTSNTMYKFLKLIYSGILKSRQFIDNEEYSMAILYLLSLWDTNVLVKVMVSNILFGDSIYKLGTDKHHFIFDELDSGKAVGCFCMTELSGGSDVQHLKTEAIYNHKTREFIINTPKLYNVKYWVGNLADTANYTLLFAKLIIDGKSYGTHSFLIKIRDIVNGSPVSNTVIGSCGEKKSHNGLDNGWIRFKNLHIPYDSLMDGFCRITKKGEYEKDVKNVFIKTISSLTKGRKYHALGAESFINIGAKIVHNYSLTRKPFKDKKIIDYQIVKNKLISIMTKSYCRTLTLMEIPLVDRTSGILCGFKAYSTEQSVKDLMTLRELLGGQGFDILNRFGYLLNTADLFRTTEGSNDLMRQMHIGLFLKSNKELLTQSDYIINKPNEINIDLIMEYMENEKIKLLKKLANYYFSGEWDKYGTIVSNFSSQFIEFTVFEHCYKRIKKLRHNIKNLNSNSHPNDQLDLKLLTNFLKIYWIEINNIDTTMYDRYVQLINSCYEHINYIMSKFYIPGYMINDIPAIQENFAEYMIKIKHISRL
tara:strand:+ start:1373 stop:3061 length:1689 start_codon:yes stop_codon:yes gene_type:complete